MGRAPAALAGQSPNPLAEPHLPICSWESIDRGVKTPPSAVPLQPVPLRMHKHQHGGPPAVGQDLLCQGVPSALPLEIVPLLCEALDICNGRDPCLERGSQCVLVDNHHHGVLVDWDDDMPDILTCRHHFINLMAGLGFWGRGGHVDAEVMGMGWGWTVQTSYL